MMEMGGFPERIFRMLLLELFTNRIRINDTQIDIGIVILSISFQRATRVLFFPLGFAQSGSFASGFRTVLSESFLGSISYFLPELLRIPTIPTTTKYETTWNPLFPAFTHLLQTTPELATAFFISNLNGPFILFPFFRLFLICFLNSIPSANSQVLIILALPAFTLRIAYRS